jgi:NADH-quinone oxidoreductase subunit H
MRKYVRLGRRKGRRGIRRRLRSVAYLTLVERKGIGGIQRRRGPNAVGVYGRRTPMADGRKLLLKETVVPIAGDEKVFIRAPLRTFSLALIGWVVIPMGEGRVYADRNCGVIYRRGVSGLGVYGIIIAGWASNSKYAFLGGLRSAAQMVSYEVSMGFVVASVRRCGGTANRTERVRKQEAVWNRRPRRPMSRRFYVSTMAETNRHPFDLPEAEAELVSGYNVEYSAVGFTLFFLGEYGNMIRMSSLTTVRFRGGWRGIGVRENNERREQGRGARRFGRKVRRLLIGYVWARAGYPRYRYDQLMRLGWKVYRPVSLGWVGRTGGVLIGRNGLV